MRQQKRYPRTARLNESVLEVLAEELERMNDPRLELVTLTGVEVSGDLAHATVYYSTLGATTTAEESFADDAAAALRAGASHLRGVLGRSLRIRQVPRLSFKVDPGIVSGQRIDELLRQVADTGIHHDGAEKDEAGGAGGRETEALRPEGSGTWSRPEDREQAT
jgi:ribosome-binding factor A